MEFDAFNERENADEPSVLSDFLFGSIEHCSNRAVAKLKKRWRLALH